MGTSVNLTPKHLLLALLIVIVWGVNFIAIYVGLKELPPFLFCTLRFGLSALPFVFFLPKPKAPLKHIIGFGIFNFALQFGLLFSGIHLGLSPGLSSLVLQVQVFFSIGLAFLFFGEKPGLLKILGSLISFIGIGIVASHVGGDVTLTGLLLTLLAAFSWASGNMSFFIDGPDVIVSSFQNISWAALAAVAYVVYVSSHLGYGLWGFLMKTYSTSAVVPFTLLIPVVGFLSSALFLGENMAAWKLWASFFIMGGLVFNLFEKQIGKLAGKVKMSFTAK